MDVAVVPLADLPAGTACFPPAMPIQETVRLQLGTCTATAQARTGAPARELQLAPDLWQALAVPYPGIRLQVRQKQPGVLELGPAVTVLYAGHASGLGPQRALARATLCYGHLAGSPGLYALAFERSIDWATGTMDGFVLENQTGHSPGPRRARFPIPAAVRLSFSISQGVANRLRERTGNRTFNWVRGMDKSRFHALLSGVRELQGHLPATRSVAGPPDLAAMLAKYGTVFVKHVTGSRGRAVARLRRLETGLEVSHMVRRQLVCREEPDLATVWKYLTPVLGRGPWVVQQGVDIRDRHGRSGHFRIVLVRDGQGRWHCPVTEAIVAPDSQLVFTNAANGGLEIPLAGYLETGHGLTAAAARQCEAEMIDLSLRAAQVLAVPFHPLGILGFDIGREVETGRLWLFEANAVPGWDYPPAVEQTMARSLTDYALYLAGWQKGQATLEELPT